MLASTWALQEFLGLEKGTERKSTQSIIDGPPGIKILTQPLCLLFIRIRYVKISLPSPVEVVHSLEDSFLLYSIKFNQSFGFPHI